MHFFHNYVFYMRILGISDWRGPGPLDAGRVPCKCKLLLGLWPLAYLPLGHLGHAPPPLGPSTKNVAN